MHNRYGILLEIYVVGTWEFANSFKSIWVGLDKIILGVDWFEVLHILFDFFPFLGYFNRLTMLPELNRAVDVNNPQPATGR